MSSQFMHGSPILLGDNTIPGVKTPSALQKLFPRIFQEVKNFGCDFYPTVIQMLTYDEISEVAAYGGFPVRFPHWKWGMEYEELQRGYQHGMHRIYEMVINTKPCYIYCLDSNTIVDNVTVIAHALFHNDFFKNNIYFNPTSQNMMNQLANHGTRIRQYMDRWGRERVIEFLDHVMRLETLIDPVKAWSHKEIKDPIIQDSRNYHQPKRLNVKEGHEYMEEYINPREWRNRQNKKIERRSAAEELGILEEPTKDVLGYLRDNANLTPWQADIVAMLYQESLYFMPQRQTKMLNEGWASYGDYNIMCRKGLCGLGQDTDDSGIIEYSKHKMGVLGGKYSTNPYKLGYEIFLDVEDRWNKGKFGEEYDNETDLVKKQNWDKKLGLGHEKVFELRKYYNDYTAIMEFFTPELCAKLEFFEWKKYPNGDVKLEGRDFKSIKSKLLNRHLNGGLPEIKLVDKNYKGRNYLLLEHTYDGRNIYPPYIEPVLESLQFIWKQPVFLVTKDSKNNDAEIVYGKTGPRSEDFIKQTRAEHEQMVA